MADDRIWTRVIWCRGTTTTLPTAPQQLPIRTIFDSMNYFSLRNCQQTFFISGNSFKLLSFDVNKSKLSLLSRSRCHSLSSNFLDSCNKFSSFTSGLAFVKRKQIRTFMCWLTWTYLLNKTISNLSKLITFHSFRIFGIASKIFNSKGVKPNGRLGKQWRSKGGMGFERATFWYNNNVVSFNCLELEKERFKNNFGLNLVWMRWIWK